MIFMGTLTLFILTAFLIYTNEYKLVYGEIFEFNREFTGVNFSPYVKTTKKDSSMFTSKSCLNHYTFDELTTMLEVVSTRFSRVVTASMDAMDVPYILNNTYYNNACIIARTAEAAATINLERNSSDLNVIVGIQMYNNQDGGERRTETEVNLALEAFRISNEIYPGTVGGFQLSNFLSDTKSANAGLRWVEYLRSRTADILPKVGIIVSSDDLKRLKMPKNISTDFHRASPENRDPMLSLIAKSSFITCKYFPDRDQAINGPTESFLMFSTFLFIYKNFLDRLDRSIETMGYTGWSSAGNYSFQNIENLKHYWMEVNKFSVNNEFPMWLHEAFDNPWKTKLDHDSPYYGWWRLKDDSEADDVSSYAENFVNPRNVTIWHPKTLKNAASDKMTQYVLVWFIGAVVTVAFIITLILFGLYKLNLKLSLQNFALSREEIRQFKSGSSDLGTKFSIYGNYVCSLAMQKPYDRNLEISKEKFEIDWDMVLGTGEFGSVHKAILKGKTPKEIALKTTKIDCPSVAFRGLLSEIKILTHLGKHPNIVSICGACTAELAKGKVYVALELCDRGSLKSHLVVLHAKKDAELISESDIESSHLKESLLRWSSEIASGMEHLGLKGVIHADLAARNVLLTKDYIAKVADFGLSRRFYEYEQYVTKGEEPVPWRWMAIESLKYRKFSTKSDVWSFGVVLWEIFSLGEEPFPGYSFDPKFIENLENGVAKMNRPKEATSDVFRIMMDCWHLQPDKRPTFGSIGTRILEICAGANYDVFLEVKP